MTKYIFFALLVGSMDSYASDVRTWKSSDGTSSFRGEYLSHDDQNVSIRREDGKVFTVGLAKLHSQDKSWLSSLGRPSAAAEREQAPDPKAVFDSLCFGDGIETVKKKLKASKLFETNLDDAYMGRTGLNGVYHTRPSAGGLQGDLFLGWSPVESLVEIALHTRPQPAEAYPAQLRETWSNYAGLLTARHGAPAQAGGYPGIPSVKEGMFLPTHRWKLHGGGSVQLGVSKTGDRYLVVVNFTSPSVQPLGMF